ncbi:MAG: alpha/beta fold hydrolase [Acidimicrobiales bacterium]|nr:alpha/beta fold hydrolase [Acidimicrobiales bacterium]
MVDLHATTIGAGPRLVLLHGFTQTSAAWAPVATRLAHRYEVTSVDLPGHGGSSAVDLDLPETAAAVAAVAGRATYVGYSMGGRVALRLALDRPDAVERLVLVGATAGIDDDGERAARRRDDEARAETIEREGVDAFLAGWLAQPLFAGLTPDPADLAARRANPSAGLAASLRCSGTGTMDPPWWSELPRLGTAGFGVRLVVGGRDAKFRSLADRMAAGIGPNATVAVVAGAGHACHLEAPDAFLTAADLG